MGGMGSTARHTLNNFMALMEDPALYPDLDRAWAAMHVFLKLFSFCLGIVAIVIMVLFVARMVIDVITILVQGYSFVSYFQRGSSFNNRQIPSDLVQYVREDLGKLILSLVFAALLMSGKALPLAGKFMQVMGSAIDVVVSLDVDISQSTERFLASVEQKENINNRISLLRSTTNKEEFDKLYNELIDTINNTTTYTPRDANVMLERIETIKEQFYAQHVNSN